MPKIKKDAGVYVLAEHFGHAWCESEGLDPNKKLRGVVVHKCKDYSKLVVIVVINKQQREIEDSRSESGEFSSESERDGNDDEQRSENRAVKSQLIKSRELLFPVQTPKVKITLIQSLTIGELYRWIGLWCVILVIKKPEQSPERRCFWAKTNTHNLPFTINFGEYMSRTGFEDIGGDIKN
eukprot:Pgem_evm1s8115